MCFFLLMNKAIRSSYGILKKASVGADNVLRIMR